MDEFTPFMRFGDVIQQDDNSAPQTVLQINNNVIIDSLVVDEGTYLFFGNVSIIENDPDSQLDFYLNVYGGPTIDSASYNGTNKSRVTLIGVGEVPKQDQQDPNYPISVRIVGGQYNGSIQARVKSRIVAMKIEGFKEV